MKNQKLRNRLGYALKGIRTAYENEASFRTQCMFSGGALLLLFALKPRPLWWALVFIAISAVLAAELINTALEFIVDRLHPEQHPMIAGAKDCAAGAVLVFSVASLGIAAAMIWDYFKPS